MQHLTAAEVGHVLAKGVGIRVREREPFLDPVTRGGSVFSLQTTDAFVEEQPSTIDFLVHLVPTPARLGNYFASLFPFTKWIGHYNFQWLIGDLIAGITVGSVVVPQGIAYASLAELPAQFGLYTGFMGTLVYWFFATSKDITIGPVAVVSQLTGNIVLDLTADGAELADVPGHVIASALAVLAGAIICFIGLIRCGWIVDLIPLVSLSAFMTGSALNIAVGQIPTLMGISGFSTKDATYLVFIRTLQGLPRTRLDAAIGLTALTMLYSIRSAGNYCARRWPQHRRLIFFILTLRTVLVILLYTMISWLVNMHLSKDEIKFKILLDVPRGFQDAAVPTLNNNICNALVPHLPATVIVLLIEHMAISKSFGRVNNYTINPSQEMVAIGVSNLLGPFLGAYASTGSFSRTAIKAKAGVRTPLAGVITACVVLLATYVLTAVFYYIPSAALAAVIIHAVGDLITPPNTVSQFWLVSPLEVVIFFVGIIVTVFSSIENGIYCTICISAAVLLFRILRAKGRFLAQVKVHSVPGDQVIGDNGKRPQAVGEHGTFDGPVTAAPSLSVDHISPAPVVSAGSSSSASLPGAHGEVMTARTVFLPIGNLDGSNPELELGYPYPGIFIYRFAEGFTYPTASHSLEHMVDYIFAHTRRTNLAQYDQPGDRPWNDPGPSRQRLRQARRLAATASAPGDASAAAEGHDKLHMPTLKAVILDLSAVNHVDITSVQTLMDVRNQLDRYASPERVDWHFAHVSNRWTKRALVSAGFGYPAQEGGKGRGGADGEGARQWRSIFTVAETSGSGAAGKANMKRPAAAGDVETGVEKGASRLKRRRSQWRGQGARVGSTDTTANQDRYSDDAAAGEEDDEPKGPIVTARGRIGGRSVAVNGVNRPLFHVDLPSALQSAIANVEAREDSGGSLGLM